jgi:hypothetical protein
MQPLKADINQVYFVECPERIMNPIAIRPHIRPNSIWWEDTSRGTSIQIEKIDIEPKDPNRPPTKIEIQTKDGQHITLTALTLNIFNSKVRDHVAGKPSFDNDEKLIKYYMETDFENY